VERALARARRFVEGAGRPGDRLRLAAMLGGPPEPLLDAVAARQEGSGAVAPLDGPRRASLLSTARALGVLADLDLAGRPCAERAACWLATRQEPDGSFAPESGRDDDARIAFTGLVATRLARSLVTPPRVLERAGAYLAARWSPERVQSGGADALEGLAGFFATVPHELADEALQWCGRELERGFRGGAWHPVRTARVLVRCRARALPGARLSPDEVVVALLEAQDARGAFAAACAVDATLDAALALVRLADLG
jgi:hypothetical protein